MVQYAQPRTLIAADAAYIAGLVDGEGTISLSRRQASDMRQLVVSIANTEVCLLNFVLECVGAGKVTRKRAAALQHASSFVYSISDRQALSLLRQIRSYLRSHKRARADLALAHYIALTPRNGKYSVEVAQLRARFEQQFLAATCRASAEVRADARRSL